MEIMGLLAKLSVHPTNKVEYEKAIEALTGIELAEQNFPAIIEALQQCNYDGYLMIEGFGYSPNEPNALGALWGDLSVSPEDIAFAGATYLASLLRRSRTSTTLPQA